MGKDDIMLKIGSWAFIIGIIIALIVGLLHAVSYEAALDDAEKAADVFFLTDNGATVAWVLAILGARFFCPRIKG